MKRHKRLKKGHSPFVFISIAIIFVVAVVSIVGINLTQKQDTPIEDDTIAPLIALFEKKASLQADVSGNVSCSELPLEEVKKKIQQTKQKLDPLEKYFNIQPQIELPRNFTNLSLQMLKSSNTPDENLISRMNIFYLDSAQGTYCIQRYNKPVEKNNSFRYHNINFKALAGTQVLFVVHHNGAWKYVVRKVERDPNAMPVDDGSVRQEATYEDVLVTEKLNLECAEGATKESTCWDGSTITSCTCGGDYKWDCLSGREIMDQCPYCDSDTWSDWSECSMNCGSGIRTRTNQCNISQQDTCNLQPCLQTSFTISGTENKWFECPANSAITNISPLFPYNVTCKPLLKATLDTTEVNLNVVAPIINNTAPTSTTACPDGYVISGILLAQGTYNAIPTKIKCSKYYASGGELQRPDANLACSDGYFTNKLFYNHSYISGIQKGENIFSPQVLSQKITILDHQCIKMNYYDIWSECPVACGGGTQSQTRSDGTVENRACATHMCGTKDVPLNDGSKTYNCPEGFALMGGAYHDEDDDHLKAIRCGRIGGTLSEEPKRIEFDEHMGWFYCPSGSIITGVDFIDDKVNKYVSAIYCRKSSKEFGGTKSLDFNYAGTKDQNCPATYFMNGFLFDETGDSHIETGQCVQLE